MAKHTESAAGTVKMRNVNGDGVIINTNGPGGDRDIIGNPNPDFIFGIVNSFSYRNFDLTVVASGSYGNDISRRVNEYLWNMDGVFNVERSVMNRWKSENDPGDGILGHVGSGRTGLVRSPNSKFVYDGSHIAIKNITPWVFVARWPDEIYPQFAGLCKCATAICVYQLSGKNTFLPAQISIS